ncbi:hypothetical protein [Rivibacter subsaxonicus]|uniref:Uncharacterized protein n=1 Tax=Rivibacter subsaxonicus TaxID=457575 RepID=A0A4Q7W1C2_9BURK|nr:hypothetical protein [Rivibacter subsaxonicus]RZU02635.1 hypothetical protein EV670_0663 [Rivibacter subsaxonicus]
MRRLPIALLFVVAATQAAPPSRFLCSADEEVVFGCTLGRRMVSLCASPGPAPQKLQYRTGMPGKLELVVPPAPEPAAGTFIHSSTGYSGGGEARLRFRNGNWDYWLFDRTLRGEQGPVFSSGVVVRRTGQRHGKELKCVEEAGFGAFDGERFEREDFDFDLLR